jgi:D-alanyl-D-alanine carboxypeptidase
MYVASLGKIFTATIALQLCDEGRLDLDMPISTWLPVTAAMRIPSSDRITLRHLLNHTSGLFDYMNDARDWLDDFSRNPRRKWTNRDILTYLYDRPLQVEPGTRFDYSNSNYILLGLIIERVTRRPLNTLIRERILNPLGLRHTFNGFESVRIEKSAHGYFKQGDRVIDTYPWFSHYGLADSGIQSTPGDLAVFIRALFSTDRLLNKAMRMEMTRVPASPRPRSRYGMGIYVLQNPSGAGLRWYLHDGVDPGYQADMIYVPEIDLAIVLFANTGMGREELIYVELLAVVVQTVLDMVLR